DLSFSEDVPGRFEASGWHVVRDADGHNAAAIEDALNEAIAVTDKPSLIAFRTVIGFGSPNKGGTSESHGAPLGADEVMKSMEKLGVDYAPFKVFDEALKLWREAGVRGNGEYTAWKKRHDAHEKALEFDEAMRADVTEGAKAELYEKAMEELKLSFAKAKPNQATRKASGSVIEAIFPAVRELIGGSADLSGSNNTMPKGCGVIEPGKYYARYIHYGVREHAMFAIMGGLSLHGGFIPYGGAFFVFVDYGRPSVRLSALMGIRVIYVMTHDSIGVGEDGRTHQPIEQLAVMRAIPNLIVGRVCDGIETAELWDIALKNKHRPTMLCLTRQNLPTIRDYQGGRVNLSAKGAYIIKGEGETRDITLLATGSEVKLALDAREKLQMDGINAVVVSMPSLELFEEQSEEYKKSVLGTAPRIAVEAGIRMCWDRYIGENGAFIGMEGFGESAPAEVLFEHFDITADRIVREAMRILNGVKR
ncbi:MAG: transketolase, partial [Alphaproteobacteria bacterium]|nr:transketolase [Alphaproteobacteria bacterium]